MTPSAVLKNIWTPAWVQEVTRGRWIVPPAGLTQPIDGLGIDSRTIRPGQAFLAVKGDQFDGHQFINKAFDADASIAIIENDHEVRDHDTPGVLLVESTTDALQQLARAYRAALRTSACHIIAVAGSNGKTTTRHLIYTVLSSHLKGTQSPKSFNNHLGVPLTILGASLDDDFLVAEVGTNHPGEIDALGELLKPDSAVITCIGKEHMEFFGDLEGVANEEAAITRHVPDQGKLFIEADAYKWVRQASSFNHKPRVTVYENEQPETTPAGLSDGRQSLVAGSTRINLPLIAPHDRLNAQAAVKVGQTMGVPDGQIKAALENVAPMPGRLEVKQFGPITIIDDTYNANPDSTFAALNVLANYKTPANGRRVAILADMLELGDAAEVSHREAGQALLKLIISKTVHQTVLIGPCMSWALEELKNMDNTDTVTHHPGIDNTTPSRITDLVQPNDVVLVKGSRGMQLEQLLPVLQNRFAV